MGVCNCSMFCCTLLYVHSSIAIILMGKRELTALLNLSYWCLVMVEWLFLPVPRGCLQFVIVVFPDHTHLQLLNIHKIYGVYKSVWYSLVVLKSLRHLALTRGWSASVSEENLRLRRCGYWMCRRKLRYLTHI